MADVEERCYRLRRSLLFAGVACTGCFLAFGLLSSLTALWNVDGSFARPAQAALFFGLFWSAWVLLGVYITAAAVRERLYVSPRRIEKVGCLRTRTMQLEDVSSAQWRQIPRQGSLVLRGRNGKLTLEFGNYGTADRRELIARLRDYLDEHLQEGWAEFEARFPADPCPH